MIFTDQKCVLKMIFSLFDGLSLHYCGTTLFDGHSLLTLFDGLSLLYCDTIFRYDALYMWSRVSLSLSVSVSLYVSLSSQVQ